MLGFCMELEQGVSGLLIIFECTAKMWHNISYMEKFQKGFVAPLLIVIIIVIIGGGVYILAKGNFCFIKINGDCKFGQNDSGITNAIRVPIKPGDSQEDVLAKIEAGFSKFANEFITAKLSGSNEDFKISGEVLSKNWATDFESKDHSAGFVEIYDANGKLLVRKGLLESGGPAVDGNFIVPFKYYNSLTSFPKPSTKQGKIILYDVNRNSNGLTKPLEMQVTFW